MELAELVERIQRWKRRIAAEQTGEAVPDVSASEQYVDNSEYGQEEAQEIDDDQVVEEEMEVDAKQIVADSEEYSSAIEGEHGESTDTQEIDVEEAEDVDEEQ
jgi:hypothetical protein